MRIYFLVLTMYFPCLEQV